MKRIFFSFKNVSVSFPQEEVERAMSVKMVGGLNLEDREQQEAIFDIVCNHCTRAQVNELSAMRTPDFLRLFVIA